MAGLDATKTGNELYINLNWSLQACLYLCAGTGHHWIRHLRLTQLLEAISEPSIKKTRSVPECARLPLVVAALLVVHEKGRDPVAAEAFPCNVRAVS